MRFPYLSSHWTEWPRLLRADRLHRRRTAGGGASASVSSSCSSRQQQPALRSEHPADWVSSAVTPTLLLLQSIASTLLYQRSPFAAQNRGFGVISTSASRVRPASTADIPAAPACRHRSAAGGTERAHIDPEHRLLPPVSPPRCAPEEGVFLNHQGAPSAGWGVWSHGEPRLRGSHPYVRKKPGDQMLIERLWSHG